MLCWEEGGCCWSSLLTQVIAFPSCLSGSGCYWSWKCTLNRIFSLLQRGECRGALRREEIEPFPDKLWKSIEAQKVNKQVAVGHKCPLTTAVCPEVKRWWNEECFHLREFTEITSVLRVQPLEVVPGDLQRSFPTQTTDPVIPRGRRGLTAGPVVSGG